MSRVARVRVARVLLRVLLQVSRVSWVLFPVSGMLLSTPKVLLQVYMVLMPVPRVYCRL